jgi:dTDP-L-rhamnose 4-epimerase
VRTLVTGGAGFIGSHLVGRLAEGADEVVVLDNFEQQVHQGRPPALPGNVTLIGGSVGEVPAIDEALDGTDRIVHLASAVGVGQSMYELDKYVRLNTMATATFLERIIARSPAPTRLVVASSMSIYGEGAYECEDHGLLAPGPRLEAQLAAGDWEVRCPTCSRTVRPVPTAESKPLRPTSVYAITKRDQEELCLVVGAAYGIPSVALRFFNVYGRGQALSNPYTGVAAILASRLLNGRPPIIFEDGEQSRDFIHVSDIVEGIMLALESDKAVGHAINLGTGRQSTVNHMATLLASGLGVDIQPQRLQEFRAGDIRHCFADTKRAEELLGFSASVTLDQGLADLVGWLEEQDVEDNVDVATNELLQRGLTSRRAEGEITFPMNDLGVHRSID